MARHAPHVFLTPRAPQWPQTLGINYPGHRQIVRLVVRAALFQRVIESGMYAVSRLTLLLTNRPSQARRVSSKISIVKTCFEKKLGKSFRIQDVFVLHLVGGKPWEPGDPGAGEYPLSHGAWHAIRRECGLPDDGY